MSMRIIMTFFVTMGSMGLSGCISKRAAQDITPNYQPCAEKGREEGEGSAPGTWARCPSLIIFHLINCI